MLSVSRICGLILLCCCVLAPSITAKQLMPPTEQPKQPEIIDYQPESAGLKQALSKLRDQFKELHSLEIRYHNSDSIEEESRYKREWYQLRESMHGLHNNLLQAALEEFLANTIEKAKLGKIIFQSLKRNVEKDNFDGMLAIAKSLYDAGYPDPELRQFYMQCCFAENEYGLAAEAIKTDGLSSDQVSEMLKQFDILAKNWEDELKARQRDAAGEPLPQAKISTTKGEIIVELFENDAPEAVANFITLAEQGSYDYSDFFLVIQHFGAQAGCPNEDGSGGPGYMIKDEFDAPNARKMFRGSLVLATLQDVPNSGGSQFYIPFLPSSVVGRKPTVFGRVISGMTNLANLNRIDPHKKDDKSNEEKDPKLPPDEIITVEIIRKRNHPYEFTRLPVHGPMGTQATNSN